MDIAIASQTMARRSIAEDRLIALTAISMCPVDDRRAATRPPASLARPAFGPQSRRYITPACIEAAGPRAAIHGHRAGRRECRGTY